MKKLFNIALQLVGIAVLLVLVALAIVTVTACGGGIASLQQPTAPLRTFWVPMPQGSDACPNAARPGFITPVDAKSCEIYDRDKAFLGSINIKGGQFYCSVPQGYVRCQDTQGEHMRPDMTRTMCGFDGPEPSCAELAPSTLPGLLAPPPPDPT
ncbi:MAG: hypothetical protein A3B90_02625 [Candidatus Magasanikbacteria bacterium RIFCSPHIGHO2_02_FULL_41_13]|uniref:Uncharacterized protein n=1 Tax=Candidatus Magasanikbacteria bacterium RIFCSPHIGHO2_02_FULL_41_13 TaxID=1798676 RepID=A0A1F6M4Z5_9BACT|nr:MAG: hypothetical protein A3B90_02625 [Candidatus Magasanikbacteria bacterium RIFCSPHIGHO2_02_FULL_41_13]